MRRRFAILSLLLALLWAPATSHCLLEHAGWIHHSHACADQDSAADHDHDHDSGDAHNHDAADGNYHLASNSVDLSKRQTAASELLAVVASVLVADVVAPRVDAPYSAESFARDFSPRWQFVLRTALPPRAPSC